MFQPSASPDAGCNSSRLMTSEVAILFQPSASPETGCNAHHHHSASPRVLRVSTLSQSGDQLQLRTEVAAVHLDFGVSTLSQSGDRLQLGSLASGVWDCYVFQPSASPETGCNVHASQKATMAMMFQPLRQSGDRLQLELRPAPDATNVRFQPSASPETGCNTTHTACTTRTKSFNPQPVLRRLQLRLLTRLWQRLAFQPSASPETGRNMTPNGGDITIKWFQPSASPETGRNFSEVIRMHYIDGYCDLVKVPVNQQREHETTCLRADGACLGRSSDRALPAQRASHAANLVVQ